MTLVTNHKELMNDLIVKDGGRFKVRVCLSLYLPKISHLRTWCLVIIVYVLTLILLYRPNVDLSKRKKDCVAFRLKIVVLNSNWWLGTRLGNWSAERWSMGWKIMKPFPIAQTTRVSRVPTANGNERL